MSVKPYSRTWDSALFSSTFHKIVSDNSFAFDKLAPEKKHSCSAQFTIRYRCYCFHQAAISKAMFGPIWARLCYCNKIIYYNIYLKQHLSSLQTKWAHAFIYVSRERSESTTNIQHRIRPQASSIKPSLQLFSGNIVMLFSFKCPFIEALL